MHHYTIIDWPDHAIPKSPSGLAELLDIVLERKRIVVHCSAGIGRTGVFVSLLLLLKEFAKGATVSQLVQ